MTSSTIEASAPLARSVTVGSQTLLVRLLDGRAIEVPLDWYPRLVHATESEREAWRLVGGGAGVHWDELDEDIEVVGLLEGRRSAESEASFHRWMLARSAASGGRSVG